MIRDRRQEIGDREQSNRNRRLGKTCQLCVTQQLLLLVLLSLVPLEVVLAREAIKVGAVGMFAAKGVHDGRGVSVLRLVPAKVLWVHEALAASWAHVRPLIAVGCLLVTTSDGQLR